MTLPTPISDILAHKGRVAALLNHFAAILTQRGLLHDNSKFGGQEYAAFEAITPRLRRVEYGGEDYRTVFREPEIKSAIAHHYAHNRHHPEFHTRGINGMTLIDLLEMLVDWKAASERQQHGSLLGSLPINVTRFSIEPQLAEILQNTISFYFPEGPHDLVAQDEWTQVLERVEA